MKLTEDTRALLDAIDVTINERIAGLRPTVRDVTISGRDLPTPTVYNEVRTPEVHVTNEVHPALPPNVTVTNEVQPAPTIVNVEPTPITVMPPQVQVHNAAPDYGPLADALDAVTAELRLFREAYLEREDRQPPKAFRLTTDGKGNKRIVAEG